MPQLFAVTPQSPRRKTSTPPLLSWLLLVLANAMCRTSQAFSATFHLSDRSAPWTFLATGIGLEPGATIGMNFYGEEHANSTYIMVLTHAQLVAWRSMEGGAHGLNSYVVCFWREPLRGHVHTSFQVRAPEKDRYYVGVFNALQSPLYAHGTLSFVNPGGQELMLQERHVPSVLLWMSLLFLMGGSIFAGVVAFSRRGRHAAHVLIVTVLVTKSAVLLARSFHYVRISRNGSDSTFGNVVWQLLDKAQTIAELMMLFLIALGWKFLRNTLSVAEKRFALGLSVLSFYLGFFEVVCSSAASCSGYQLSRYILHSLCYLVVIVAMNFNLQMISLQITESPASPDAGKLYSKRYSYTFFRWIILAFIIAPTIELFFEVAVVPWDAAWVCILLKQLRCLAIYGCICAAFRPDPPSPRLFDLTRGAGDDDDYEVGVAGDSDDQVE